MKLRGLVLLVVAAIVGAAAYWYLRPQDEAAPVSTKFTSKHGSSVTIDTPKSGDEVSSPLKITGVVPGPWSFEANFPVEIVDASHKRVAEGFATVQGDWMTMDPVKFTAELAFKRPKSDTGFVVVHKANPSGDQATDDSVEVPITFGAG